MEILRKNQKEMLEIKNTVTEIKKAFDGLCSGEDMAEESTSELGNMSIASKLKSKEKKTKN